MYRLAVMWLLGMLGVLVITGGVTAFWVWWQGRPSRRAPTVLDDRRVRDGNDGP